MHESLNLTIFSNCLFSLLKNVSGFFVCLVRVKDFFQRYLVHLLFPLPCFITKELQRKLANVIVDEAFGVSQFVVGTSASKCLSNIFQL